MNINLNSHISSLVGKLEIASVLLQFSERFSHNIVSELSDRELSSLIGYASILSLSDDPKEISVSYEVITRLLEYTRGNCLKTISAAEVILSRIGNFPGRTLLRQRYLNFEKNRWTPSLQLECVAREAENTIYTSQSEGILLTDFQYKFFDSLDVEKALSVSAPTSAGKSFILNLDLVRKIKDKRQSIVYIVPTRALIAEVSSRIRATLKAEGLSSVIVRTAPFPVDISKVTESVVYVLTQERMMSFINSKDIKPYVTSLIIDEAHEIQNGKRGIVLQNAIDLTLSRFNNVNVLFASPLIKNPGYLLSLFNRTENGRFFIETISPVSQNLIMIDKVKGKPSELSVSLLSKGVEIPVGNISTNFKFRGPSNSQRAELVLSISSNVESVISFSNGASEAEKVAVLISKLVDDYSPSENVYEFVDFLVKEIHPEYPLINTILKGVGFHYGNMPSLVRTGVERLFKNGDIKIICCTSTLLQGVNLPAKHIVIENPMSGLGNPMTRADFLNLAGRAGRLLKEFHGNIWCVRATDWDSDCYKGEQLQEIKSAISKIMDDGGSEIHNLLNNQNKTKGSDAAEAALGKLFYDSLVDPELECIEKYRNETNSCVLEKTVEYVKGLKVSLPIEVLENNQSIRPDYLERLYKYLSEVDNLLDWFPMSPYIEGAKIRMEAIFSVIRSCISVISIVHGLVI